MWFSKDISKGLIKHKLDVVLEGDGLKVEESGLYTLTPTGLKYLRKNKKGIRKHIEKRNNHISARFAELDFEACELFYVDLKKKCMDNGNAESIRLLANFRQELTNIYKDRF